MHDFNSVFAAALRREHVLYVQWQRLRQSMPDTDPLSAARMAARLVAEHQTFLGSLHALRRKHRLRDVGDSVPHGCPVCGDSECAAAMPLPLMLAFLVDQQRRADG